MDRCVKNNKPIADFSWWNVKNLLQTQAIAGCSQGSCVSWWMPLNKEFRSANQWMYTYQHMLSLRFSIFILSCHLPTPFLFRVRCLDFSLFSGDMTYSISALLKDNWECWLCNGSWNLVPILKSSQVILSSLIALKSFVFGHIIEWKVMLLSQHSAQLNKKYLFANQLSST